MKEDIIKPDHIHGNRDERNRGPWGRGTQWFGMGGPQGPHDRSRWGRGHQGPGPGRGQQDWFGGDGWPRGGPFDGPGMGRGRERLERGLLRHVILSVLKDGPQHGYEIIKQLEEKTNGRYAPSPGTLYPTLQFLAEAGLVQSEQEGEKRIYSLTETGRAELDKQHTLVEGFWSRFRERVPSGVTMHELRFAGDALKDLMRTVGGGLHSGAFARNPEAVSKIRQALERCQTEIREIIANSSAGKDTSGDEESAEDYV
ncbi:MAG: PadR family transcriptional regulator [Chloroflexia bacterium]